jgi:5-methylcytosine-specific restriction protein B
MARLSILVCMARIREPKVLAIYAAATRWMGRALHSSRGIFVERPVWLPEALHELSERLAGQPERGQRFEDAWHQQLDGSTSHMFQLAAELVYVHLLFPTDVSPASKRRLVHRTAERATPVVPVPEEFDVALDRGIAPTGPAFKTRRHSQLRFLLRVAQSFQRLPARERNALTLNPWACKAWLAEVPADGGTTQREALLHLLFPDTFEPIVSIELKRAIVAGLPHYLPAGVTDVDAALGAIRSQITPTFGRDFRFTDRQVMALWRPQS